jgi:hypothetical protein
MPGLKHIAVMALVVVGTLYALKLTGLDVKIGLK